LGDKTLIFECVAKFKYFGQRGWVRKSQKNRDIGTRSSSKKLNFEAFERKVIKLSKSYQRLFAKE
jgi:hypothetical protein